MKSLSNFQRSILADGHLSEKKLGGYSRPTIQRMQIIWALVRSGAFPNATQLARYLETSTKSIHRDIQFMRDRLLFDIRYDGSRFGYWTPPGPVRCLFCDRNLQDGGIAYELGQARQEYAVSKYTRRGSELSDTDA